MSRLFDNAETLRGIAAALVEPFRGAVTEVAGIESRGFILGPICALELGVGFVPIRKEAGLFPDPKADWVETGSQAVLARSLIEACGAAFAGLAGES